MEEIKLDSLIKINKIIERDNLSSSYKLVLLKGTVLTVNKYEHLIEKEGENKVKIPFYFIVEQWFFDYLPFVINEIKQQTNQKKSQILNKEVEELYKQFLQTFEYENSDWKNTYSLIYSKYYNHSLTNEQKTILTKLFKAIRKTIVVNPMKYIGEKHYEIFNIGELPRVYSLDYKKFGYFYIDTDIYNVFKYLGYNILGLNTIYKRWMDFTLKINPHLKQSEIYNYITFDIQNVLRNTTEIRKLLQHEKVYCVWTGKKINEFDVDHVIPFSIYFNNDLWNLMPSSKKINNKKRDKIPTPDLIENRQDLIIKYWKLYKEKFNYFTKQREISLGEFTTEEGYINSLKQKCDFLINKLGFDYFE
jgi:hypothetical protein